jgi:hypothetical protein
VAFEPWDYPNEIIKIVKPDPILVGGGAAEGFSPARELSEAIGSADVKA